MSTKMLMSEKLESVWTVGEVSLTWRRKAQVGSNYQILSSQDVADFIFERWDDPDSMAIKEKFFVLYLNQANRVMSMMKISEGGVSGTVIDVRHIAVSGLLLLASAAILVHNHPSGNTKPSEADVKVTKKIRDALKQVDMSLLDHLIVTPDKAYLSMSDEGIL